MASRVSEWTARALRPVAHWVQMPDASGRPALMMVWEVLDPMPSDVIGDAARDIPSSRVSRERVH